MDLIQMSREILQIKEAVNNIAEHECGEFYYELETFEQSWSNTSCAFESIGGCAVTWQRTYVLIPKEYYRTNRPKNYLVFFGGNFGYMVPITNEKFKEDLNNKSLAGIKTATKKYELR